MRPRGFGRVFLRTRVWWVQYSYRGVRHRESSGSPNRGDAVRLLRRRLAEMGRGQLIGPDVERTTFEDLKEMLLNDYKANGRASLAGIRRAIRHLGGAFTRSRALDITTDRIKAYIASRQQAGAANGTVALELAALKRMFRLGEQAGKVERRPYIPALEVHNARKGFLEPDQFRAVLAHLPEDLRPVFEAAYATGWRVQSELLTRRWQHVDFQAGWLRLEPGETKNRDGRMFPLTPALRATLECQWARTEALQRETGQIIPWVFHRKGKPIGDFRTAWRRACVAAGLAGRLPHDLRRTAVRNLERAGVSRSVAMELIGHRTEAIYRRYAITTEADLREGAVKLAALHQAQAGSPGRVVSHKRAQKGHNRSTGSSKRRS